MSVTPGQSFLLDVWAHIDRTTRKLHQNKEWLVKTVGPTYLSRGSRIDVRLSIPDLKIVEKGSMQWAGIVSNCNFGLSIPEDTKLRDYVGTSKISVAGVEIASVSFLISVKASAQETLADATLTEHRIASAFASYASQDRKKVSLIIQGMRSVLPDLDVFLDVLSLRSGERWRERIEEEIVDREAFFLFWSLAAKQSEVVEWERRTALKFKGLDSIQPVPINSPDEAPPPAELKDLHINDRYLAIRHQSMA